MRIPVEMSHALLPVFYPSRVCLSVFILLLEFCWLNHHLLDKAQNSSKVLFAEKPLGDDHYSSSTVSCKQILRLHKRTFVVVVSRRQAFLKIRKLIRLIKKIGDQ